MNTRNKALIITGVILLIIALIVFSIAGYLSGWNIEEWVKSPSFIWVCVILGLYFIGVVSLFVMDKINRL